MKRDKTIGCPVCARKSVRCLGKDFSIFSNPKTGFICDSCGHFWQHGYDGGEYLNSAKKYHKQNRIPFPKLNKESDK